MTMSANRWTAIAESHFPWEREAIEFLRGRLPDQEPWHAWSNFEFVDDGARSTRLTPWCCRRTACF